MTQNFTFIASLTTTDSFYENMIYPFSKDRLNKDILENEFVNFITYDYDEDIEKFVQISIVVRSCTVSSYDTVDNITPQEASKIITSSIDPENIPESFCNLMNKTEEPEKETKTVNDKEVKNEPKRPTTGDPVIDEEIRELVTTVLDRLHKDLFK